MYHFYSCRLSGEFHQFCKTQWPRPLLFSPSWLIQWSMGEGSYITLGLFSPSDVTAFHRIKYGGGGVIGYNLVFTEWRHCVSQNLDSIWCDVCMEWMKITTKTRGNWEERAVWALSPSLFLSLSVSGRILIRPRAVGLELPEPRPISGLILVTSPGGGGLNMASLRTPSLCRRHGLSWFNRYFCHNLSSAETILEGIS